MLTRLAENIFWLGRYLERAEQTAKLADVTWHAMLESPPDEVDAEWRVVLGALKATSAVDARLASAEPSPDVVLQVLLNDREHQDSVISSVVQARENARSVRELISLEFWEAVNGLWLDLINRDLGTEASEGPYQLLGQVRTRCQAAIGIAEATMPRSEGWAFMTLGRTLERAQTTLRLVAARWPTISGREADDHAWASLLRSMSALEGHRTEHGGRLTPESILDLVVRSRRFPRSVLFNLDVADEMLVQLRAEEDSRPRRQLGRVRSVLANHTARELLSLDAPALLSDLEDQLWVVADAVAKAFFEAPPTAGLTAVNAR